ncbi:hypothetical protein ANN_01941 [Periplaneta americana]|uniref:Mariner Mos1 transposase n=1 Tax=Periplaneta americana TaxID=6978 RepID=A0ABQ8TYC4_PERAM|nr:hypothetical protein ANN_01941 [Periplaneta americana]
MFIVAYDIDGVILHHAVPPRQTVNADYYCRFLQHHLCPALRRKRRHLGVQNPIILHDNAKSHTTAAVKDLLRRWQWEILEHPPYSPDMIHAITSIEDLALSIQHVNLRWKEVSHDDKLWKNAIFEPGDTLTDEDVVQHLKNMPALRAFSATQGTKMKLLIDTLCNSCREVQRLDLHKTYMLRTMSAQLQSAQLLGQCKSLTTLSFDGSHGYVVKGMLEPVADGCPSLQHIHLGYCEFSADDIRYLLEKKKHQLLSFSAKFFFFTGIFKFLSECTKLEHLHIENDNDNLTYDDIHPLKQLTNLKYFALQYFFKYVPFLQHLNVSSCHCLGIPDSRTSVYVAN